MMKRIIQTMLTLVLLVFFIVPTSALSSNLIRSENDFVSPAGKTYDEFQNELIKKIDSSKNKFIIKINLYEFYRNLADNILLSSDKNTFSNLEQDKIEAILNYKQFFTNQIKDLSRKSIDELKVLNYSETQINAILNFDGSEQMLIAASSVCTVYGGFINYVATSTKTSTTLIAAFDWSGYNGGPTGYGDDIFTVQWTSPFKRISTLATTVYQDTTTPINHTQYKYPVVNPSGLYADNIIMPKLTYSYSPFLSYRLKGGSIQSKLETNTYQSEIAAYAEYGLNVLSFTPSVSVGAGGFGAGFTYSFSVHKVASARWYN